MNEQKQSHALNLLVIMATLIATGAMACALGVAMIALANGVHMVRAAGITLLLFGIGNAAAAIALSVRIAAIANLERQKGKP